MKLSTDQVSPAKRFGYWADTVCGNVFALDCSSPGRDIFGGMISSHLFGGLTLTKVVSEAQTVAHTRRQVLKSSDDDMVVSLMIRGKGHVVQDGREATVSSGDLVLKDGSRPFTMHFDKPFAKWVLKIPRAALDRRLGRSASLAALSSSGKASVGRLTRVFLTGLAELPGFVPEAVQERLAGQALDMIAMAIAEQAHTHPGEGAHRTMLGIRMRCFVEQHLHLTELNGTLIAERFRMSARSVRDVFAASGTTPGRHVLSRRLARAHALLSDPSQAGRSVADIAYSVGFADLPHFSRSFRAAFGQSPRALRGPDARSAVLLRLRHQGSAELGLAAGALEKHD